MGEEEAADLELASFYSKHEWGAPLRVARDAVVLMAEFDKELLDSDRSSVNVLSSWPKCCVFQCSGAAI